MSERASKRVSIEHKALHLPPALQDSQSAAPATKSARRGRASQKAASALEICTSRFTMLRLPRNMNFKIHKTLRLPRNLHFEVQQKAASALEIYTSRFTMLRLPRNMNFKIHKTLRLPRNLHFEVHKRLHLPSKSALRGSQSAAPATKSALPSLRSAAPATKSALRGSQSAAPATKSALRSKAAPISRTCHEKSTLDHQSTRFPLRLP